MGLFTINSVSSSSSSFDTLNVNSIIFGGDTYLVRDAADTLALRNGASSQNLRIYKTDDGAGNYERAEIGFDAFGNFRLDATKGGTGAIRRIFFIQGGSGRWFVETTGHWLAGADNTYDIGASGATRPRNVYVGTDITAGGLVKWGTTASEPAIKRNGAAINFRLADDSSDAAITASDVTLSGGLTAGGSQQVRWLNRAIITSPGSNILLLRGNAGDGVFDMLKFAGQTANEPAIKRNGAGIDFKLADDSAYANVIASELKRRRAVIEIATDTAIAESSSATSSDAVIHNTTGTALIVNTLPAGASGLTYTFYVTDADGISIKGNGAEQIRYGSSLSTATTGDVQSTTIGSSITVVWLGSYWGVISAVGTWIVN